jgi:hypothetical protein
LQWQSRASRLVEGMPSPLAPSRFCDVSDDSIYAKGAPIRGRAGSARRVTATGMVFATRIANSQQWPVLGLSGEFADQMTKSMTHGSGDIARSHGSTGLRDPSSVLDVPAKKTLAAHPRESIAVEWARDACLVGPDVGGGGHYAAKLGITSAFGTKTFWVRERRRDRAQSKRRL